MVLMFDRINGFVDKFLYNGTVNSQCLGASMRPLEGGFGANYPFSIAHSLTCINTKAIH